MNRKIMYLDAKKGDDAMPVDWGKLLTKKRFGKGGKGQEDVFVKDIRRIIYSPPFRRMQGKTQVFLKPGVDHIRNRLTHSLEVANVATEIATKFLDGPGSDLIDKGYHDDFKNCTHAAALLHDIGNPPFGHKGETAIQDFFEEFFQRHDDLFGDALSKDQKSDFINFDGNAQGLRIITRLTGWKGNGGLRLSYATIAAFMKYPFLSCDPCETTYRGLKNRKRKCDGRLKFCIMQDDIQNAKEIFDNCGLIVYIDNNERKEKEFRFKRHPIAYIVEAADDICYNTTDLEDAFRLDIKSSEAREILLNLAGMSGRDIGNLFPGKDNDPDWMRDQIYYIRSKAIDNLVSIAISRLKEQWECITRNGEVFSVMEGENPELEGLNEARKFCEKNIYTNSEKLRSEYRGYNIIHFLLGTFCESFVRDCKREREGKNPLEVDKMIKSMIPKEYRVNIKTANTYKSLLSIVDYISGMTDNYAEKLYKELQ